MIIFIYLFVYFYYFVLILVAGLVLCQVSEGSLAEQAGVQVGDIILKINGKECDTMRHKEAQDAIVNAGNYLELYLERLIMEIYFFVMIIRDH